MLYLCLFGRSGAIWGLGVIGMTFLKAAICLAAASEVFNMCRERESRSCLAVHMSEVAHPAGLEPATYALEVRCSIQLSYGCILFYLFGGKCFVLVYNIVSSDADHNNLRNVLFNINLFDQGKTRFIALWT